MFTVTQWTGREAVLLQSVMRLSNRNFAEQLGVSFGTVMNWRRGRDTVVPQPPTQQILDTALREQCTPEQQQAFMAQLQAIHGPTPGYPPLPAARAPDEAVAASSHGELAVPCGPFTVTSHKFLPVYLGDQLAPLWGQARPVPEGPAGLQRRALPLDRPGATRATLYLYACGIALCHLDQEQRPHTITGLAEWRYRTYLKDRAWTGQQLARLLPGRTASDLEPEYVLSVYELGEHPWGAQVLPTAMQLLATPSVLVDRRDPNNVHGLDGTEQQLLTEQWEHPDAVEFSGAISMGLAGWSGIAYHPLPGERALTTHEILDLELDVQALWALSTHIHGLLDSGQDPVMPREYGCSYLAAAYARLTQSGPVETVQHRLMRKAILATSELPERLKAAQDVLRP